MKSHMAVTIACVLSLMTAAACARSTPPPDRISSEGSSQSDLGKQIVTDTQRSTEAGGNQDQLQLNPEGISEQPSGTAMSPSPFTEQSQGHAVKGKVIAKDDSGVILRGDPSGSEVSLKIEEGQLRDLAVGDTIEAEVKDGQTTKLQKVGGAGQ